MSDERQHHLRSRLKQVSMNNWNYTDTFLIIHHKMLNISLWNRTIGYRIIQCVLGLLAYRVV